MDVEFYSGDDMEVYNTHGVTDELVKKIDISRSVFYDYKKKMKFIIY